MAAVAMRKAAGRRFTATTEGPDASLEDEATAATGMIPVSRMCGGGPGNRGAAAPTAPAKIRGKMTATPNAGVRVIRTDC